MYQKNQIKISEEFLADLRRDATADPSNGWTVAIAEATKIDMVAVIATICVNLMQADDRGDDRPN